MSPHSMLHRLAKPILLTAALAFALALVAAAGQAGPVAATQGFHRWAA